MEFSKKRGEIFVPSGAEISTALSRTTSLCVAAHQDDIEIMAFGPISQCYAKKDKWFTGVIVSDGAGSPRTGSYENFTNEEMIDVRILEQKKAASVGDYSAQIFLGFQSSEIKDTANQWVVEELSLIIKLTEPEVLFTHNLADKHDTHVATALKAIKAVRSLPFEKRPKKLYALEVWRSLDWLCDSDKKVFDTSQKQNIANALLGVFDSQIDGGKRYDLASMGRRIANATFFESHNTDKFESVSFGIDMSELLTNDGIEPVDFIKQYIDRFADDVYNKIRKYGNI